MLLNQLRHYHACLEIFKMKPSKESREFSELVGFVSQARPPSAFGLCCDACHLPPCTFGALPRSAEARQVAAPFTGLTLCSACCIKISLSVSCGQVVGCYPKETAGFAAELMQLLDTHHAVLDAGLRQTLVKALILLRNRGQARWIVH